MRRQESRVWGCGTARDQCWWWVVVPLVPVEIPPFVLSSVKGEFNDLWKSLAHFLVLCRMMTLGRTPRRPWILLFWIITRPSEWVIATVGHSQQVWLLPTQHQGNTPAQVLVGWLGLCILTLVRKIPKGYCVLTHKRKKSFLLGPVLCNFGVQAALSLPL